MSKPDLKLLIGADPEVFVMQGGKFVSAHGLVEGTKDVPFAVDCGAVQVDGMALEFNIDPAANSKEFEHNISTVMSILDGMVPDHTLNPVPTATFGAEYMSQQPEEATEMGCDPDFNAWTGGDINPKPDSGADFRTGAGHIHIGWTKDVDINNPDHLEACITVVKQLDWSLGILSTLFDKDVKRRNLYGDWGAFRPKSYGVEYRVLSNAWLQDPRLVKWVYATVTSAVQRLYKGEHNYCEDAKPEARHIKYLEKVWKYELPPKV